MQNTRGGQGTAENYYPDNPVINTLRDIDHRTRIHIIGLLREAQIQRYQNKCLEEQRKKRITAADVMAEQNMFQEEILKLQARLNEIEDRQKALQHGLKRLTLLEEILNETVATLNALQESFVAHTSSDTSGAITAVNTTNSRGTGDPTQDTEFFEFIEKLDWDCYCEENLVCPKHPKKEPGQ